MNGHSVHHLRDVEEWMACIQKHTQEINVHQEVRIPTFFLRFLHIVLPNLNIPHKRARLYGVSTTLLHMGLNRYLLTQYPPTDVLLGDYLSIQFYHLLSKEGEVEGINYLAKAITRINENNLTHYIWRKKGVPYDISSLKTRQKVVSELPLAVVDFLGRFEKSAITDIIPAVFLIRDMQSFQHALTAEGEMFLLDMQNMLKKSLPRVSSIRLQRNVEEMLKEYRII